MKKIGLMLLPLIWFGTMPVQAADDAAMNSTKIAVVDIMQLLQQAPQMEVASEKLQKEFKPRQDKIAKLQESLTDEENKLKRDNAVLSKSELSKLQDSIASKQRDLRRLQEDYVQDVRAAENQAVEQVVNRIKEIIQTESEKEHYDLILQRDAVAYASSRIDITAQVLKQLKDKK